MILPRAIPGILGGVSDWRYQKLLVRRIDKNINVSGNSTYLETWTKKSELAILAAMSAEDVGAVLKSI